MLTRMQLISVINSLFAGARADVHVPERGDHLHCCRYEEIGNLLVRVTISIEPVEAEPAHAAGRPWIGPPSGTSIKP